MIERRDQGCVHPLCTQTRWLHIHHIVFWHHGGLTIPSNLVCLCPTHHRELHEGLLSHRRATPTTAPSAFLDRHGTPIEPPGGGPPTALRLDEPSPFTPPYGERLDPRWFSWN